MFDREQMRALADKTRISIVASKPKGTFKAGEATGELCLRSLSTFPCRLSCGDSCRCTPNRCGLDGPDILAAHGHVADVATTCASRRLPIPLTSGATARLRGRSRRGRRATLDGIVRARIRASAAGAHAVRLRHRDDIWLGRRFLPRLRDGERRTLVSGEVHPPPHMNREVELRRIETEAEWERVWELQVRCRHRTF